MSGCQRCADLFRELAEENKKAVNLALRVADLEDALWNRSLVGTALGRDEICRILRDMRMPGAPSQSEMARRHSVGRSTIARILDGRFDWVDPWGRRLYPEVAQ